MFKNVLVPKSRYFGTMVQLVQESPTRVMIRRIVDVHRPSSSAEFLRSCICERISALDDRPRFVSCLPTWNGVF